MPHDCADALHGGRANGNAALHSRRLIDNVRLSQVKGETSNTPKTGNSPELKNHGELNVADVPGAIPAKLPSALSTSGLPLPPKPVHAVTSDAVADEDEFNSTPPTNVMLPEIGVGTA